MAAAGILYLSLSIRPEAQHRGHSRRLCHKGKDPEPDKNVRHSATSMRSQSHVSHVYVQPLRMPRFPTQECKTKRQSNTYRHFGFLI
jgi:hypothetical protein